MNTLSLTDKELTLIINTLTDRIRYKGVQKLLVNMHKQLESQKLQQEIGELCEDKSISAKEWKQEVGKRMEKISELTDTE
tara:strand:- start:1287 stop:1526 length:240 start_codon:yes stop_codon:yes gene_type:complete